jgi:hypothetical protein
MGSYDDCNLNYKCKQCGAHFSTGEWIKLNDPTVPLAFHNCDEEYQRRMELAEDCSPWYPPPLPLPFKGAKGVGDLISITFRREKVSEHERELEEQFAIVTERNEVLENTLLTIRNICGANLPQDME